MGLSFGDPDLHDPPYTDQMNWARKIVKAACDKAGIAFLCSWHDPSMTEEERARYVIEEIGARILGVPRREIAESRREASGRIMKV